MKLSVCLNSVTGKMEKTEAMRLAKSIGYSAVEFWEGTGFPIGEYKRTLEEEGLTLACMGFATNLVDPAGRPAFLENVKVSLANAKTLGAKGFIATTGQELPGVSREAQRQSIVDGLKEAAGLMAGSGKFMVLEPLNVLVDHRGYYLYSSREAFQIIREVNCPEIKVLFDIYHQQISEGNLIRNITENIDLIGHFHVAGNPGRGEPYKGEINYGDIFLAADQAGYTGYAGLEYWPAGDMEESLRRCLEIYCGGQA